MARGVTLSKLCATIPLMKNRIYVIGHRNPDTDSIVSSIAYAHLKRAQGMESCIPVRAGKLTPQTDYILKRFGFEAPLFVGDLIPRVENYLSPVPSPLPSSTPLWEALESLSRSPFKLLPIVDGDGRYLSSLHYNVFARNLLKKVNPRRKTVTPTSLELLQKTLQAQPILLYRSDEFFNAQMVVAASEFSTFRSHLGALNPESTLVITGDRKDIQKHAVEAGVRALIITGGTLLDKEIREEAERKRVSVLISPCDTASTSLLTIYSTPVRVMGDESLTPLKGSDYIRDIRDSLLDSPPRSLPVVDDEGHIQGILSQSSLIGDPNIQLILVDHNELSQAVEGVENFHILEILDHHRLAPLTTRTPVTFINKPVGATSTIISGLFQEGRIPLRREMASLLLTGILADTLVLRSATTTESDRAAAEYLAQLADLEIETLGSEVMSAASVVCQKPVPEIIGMDFKRYTVKGRSLSVSQVEVTSPLEIMDRRGEILEELERIRHREGFLLSALMVSNITALSSHLFVAGDESFLRTIGYPRDGQGAFFLKEVLSRKKQLMPYLIELVERFS